MNAGETVSVSEPAATANEQYKALIELHNGELGKNLASVLRRVAASSYRVAGPSPAAD